MQDFAPFTLSGLQTPGRKGSRESSAQRMARINLPITSKSIDITVD
jgi:hypothetical protein